MQDFEGAVVFPPVSDGVVRKVGPEPGRPLPAADDVAHPEDEKGTKPVTEAAPARLSSTCKQQKSPHLETHLTYSDSELLWAYIFFPIAVSVGEKKGSK